MNDPCSIGGRRLNVYLAQSLSKKKGFSSHTTNAQIIWTNGEWDVLLNTPHSILLQASLRKIFDSKRSKSVQGGFKEGEFSFVLVLVRNLDHRCGLLSVSPSPLE